tara:strand:+ start:275 stop:541 length:267 start_codon:yes stop_codon:yes gene_type:complete
MSKKNMFKEDVLSFLGGTSSFLGSLKEELEERVKDRVEKVINKLELIDKSEFFILKEMLEKSILENEKLEKRIKILEKRILAKNKTKK